MTLLIITCCVFATTTGYDSGLMNGINMMPQYIDWFQLTTVTLALNTCATYIGWFLAAFLMGPVVERASRKGGVIVSILLKLVGIALMASAQGVGMFLAGRIILGWAKGTVAIASSTWLAETLPAHIRGRGLSVTYSVFFVGALIASGICYGTANIASSWSWRLPCLLMSMWSLICICVLFATPESPRWLVYHDKGEDALRVLASIYADGDMSSPVVLQEYRNILETIEREREGRKNPSYKALVKTPSARKRLMLALSVAVISMLSGNNIVSYYLGAMLTTAGVYDQTARFQINIVLNAWSLVCALTGTSLMDKAGRKTLCLIACCMMTVGLFLVGALTRFYGNGASASGVYATVAMIFVFQGSYSFGITPITQLYPPEVLGYSMRANGMAAWTFVVNICGLFSTLVMPIALASIGWRLYLINGGWDALQALFVAFFWIETKGMSLENIDRIINGQKPLGEIGSEDRVSSDDVGSSTKDKDLMTEKDYPRQ
ncbi:hypothetical protein S40288_03279 [Stachybotrys chartarum IBT 40288]|nr:hypothetical protein S40288_03279 [Stachybotrys chartarum IBT 40288]